jgi:hypothetical protein
LLLRTRTGALARPPLSRGAVARRSRPGAAEIGEKGRPQARLTGRLRRATCSTVDRPDRIARHCRSGTISRVSSARALLSLCRRRGSRITGAAAGRRRPQPEVRLAGAGPVRWLGLRDWGSERQTARPPGTPQKGQRRRDDWYSITAAARDLRRRVSSSRRSDTLECSKQGSRAPRDAQGARRTDAPRLRLRSAPVGSGRAAARSPG